MSKLTVISVIGFLLGVTSAGAAGYYYLLGEYNSASNALLVSVQELQESTDKVSRDVARQQLFMRVCL